MIETNKLVVEYDGPGNPYVEVPSNTTGDMIRVTVLRHAYGEKDLPPSVRVQLRPAKGGAPWPGPEFLGDSLPDFMRALALAAIQVGEMRGEPK